MIAVGQPAPDFSAPATSGKTVSLSGLAGKYCVVYFYPKDNTCGCIQEGSEFRDLHEEFAALGCEILGVSRDGLKSHENFKRKQEFPFELLSDADEALCRQFDTLRPKNMYGRQFVGIERSTFLIGPDGRLLREWRKVKVAGHAREVLETLRAVAVA